MSNNNNFNLNTKVVLTNEQLQYVQAKLYEIAEGLEQIKQKTPQNDSVLLHKIVDRVDHDVFRIMQYAGGVGDIDDFCGNDDGGGCVCHN
jgi:hypothetical protein